MSDPRNSQELLAFAERLVSAAKKAGADAADAVVTRSSSVSVSVRLGKVEGTEASESDDFSLRVFSGRKVASISASAGSDPDALAERAVAMAKAAPEDEFQSLADRENLVKDPRDLDLFDPTQVSSEALTEAALRQEAAALAVAGITNSGGSSASAGFGGMVLVTSDGFAGHYIGSRFGRGVSVIAGEGTGMQRDYEFSSRIHFAELEDPEFIGRKAAERAVRRLSPRKVKTGPGQCRARPARGARFCRASGRRDQRRGHCPQDQFSEGQDGRTDFFERHQLHRRPAENARLGFTAVRRRRH